MNLTILQVDVIEPEAVTLIRIRVKVYKAEYC